MRLNEQLVRYTGHDRDLEPSIVAKIRAARLPASQRGRVLEWAIAALSADAHARNVSGQPPLAGTALLCAAAADPGTPDAITGVLKALATELTRPARRQP